MLHCNVPLKISLKYDLSTIVFKHFIQRAYFNGDPFLTILVVSYTYLFIS